MLTYADVCGRMLTYAFPLVICKVKYVGLYADVC
jgi:hypothetical protein